MKAFDRFLQRWRIDKALAHLPDRAFVADIGCSDGALFRRAGAALRGGVGLDPALPAGAEDTIAADCGADVRLVRGLFPAEIPAERPFAGPFDAITALAVLEHMDESELDAVARASAARLRPGGRFVATVPSPLVDPILHVLQAIRVIDGMHVDEHHEMDAAAIPEAFVGAGFRLVRHERFQLGLNNLFVFEWPGATG